MKKQYSKLLFVILVFATLTFIFSGMAGAATTTDEFDVVMAAAIANNGSVPPAGQITATNLGVRLNNTDPSDDPLIIDLRTEAEFNAGHIPHAMNEYYRKLGRTQSLAKITRKLARNVAMGGDNLLVTYGNTHHYKVFALYLSIQGFNVKNLSHGFASWTKDRTVAPGAFLRCTSFDSLGHGTAPAGCTSNDFPVTTSNYVNVKNLSGEGYPQIDCIAGPATAADLAEITRCVFDAQWGQPAGPDFRITSAELYDILDDNQDGTMRGTGDDLSNDPFVLSNRGTLWNRPTCSQGPDELYGHGEGFVSVDWCLGTQRMELQTLANTDFMPLPDKLVVHHCWVGQSQQYGASWYPLLGYNVISMDYGMNGWSDDDTVIQAVINPANWYKEDFPYASGH